MTLEQLREMFSYDPATGVIERQRSPDSNGRSGPCAIRNRHGYLMVSVKSQKRAAHRLAWLLHQGKLPECEIDHINGDKTDNRLCNLREASKAQNCANVPVRADNKTGFKGVHFSKSKGKFEAKIRKNGTQVSLGSFDKAEDAGAAYATAALEIHGEFARIK